MLHFDMSLYDYMYLLYLCNVLLGMTTTPITGAIFFFFLLKVCARMYKETHTFDSASPLNDE